MSGDRAKGNALLAAAVEILRAAPGHALKTVLLNKALFYLDLCALRDTGQAVTDSAYIALEHGPVVARYDKRLVRALRDEGLAEQLETADALEKPIRLTADASMDTRLNPYVRRKAVEVARYFALLSSKRASEISHRNPGWQLAYAAGAKQGGAPKAIDMRIALQEIVDADPWLDEGPDEDFDRAIARAEAGETVPWSIE